MTDKELNALKALADAAIEAPRKTGDYSIVWPAEDAFQEAANPAVIKALIARVRAAEALAKWRPMEIAPDWVRLSALASPPLLGQHIVKVYDGYSYSGEYQGAVVQFDNPTTKALGWMPLPPPPVEKE